MSDVLDLLRRFVENRDQLSDSELESMAGALRAQPELAIELKDQLIVDELLSQKFELTRWHFLPQIDQRLRDELEGFTGIQEPDLARRSQAASESGDVPPEAFAPGVDVRLAPGRRGNSKRSAEGRSTWRAWLLVTVLVIACMAGGVWTYTDHSRVGQLESVAGDAQIVSRGQSRAAEKGSELQFEDQIVTSSKSSVLVRFVDGSALKAGSSTAVTFHTSNTEVRGKRIYVDHGRISTDVVPQPAGQPMVIGSANATAEVLGTSLQFLVAGQQTHVSVSEGEVKVTCNASHESRVVSRNEFAVVTPGHVAAAPSGWPSTQKGLIFLYETNDQPNLIRSSATGMNRSFALRPRGQAHLNHDYAMVLTGGAFLAEDVDGEILASCRQTNELTIEATVRPTVAKQVGPARIVTFSTSVTERDFTIGQLDDKLIVRIRTPQAGPNGVEGVGTGLPVCKLTAGEVNHVVISYKPGTLVCYLNGKQVFEGHQIQGDFRSWNAQHLLFGDEYAGERNWAGLLEGVAIYNRFLEPEEAARNALQYEHLRQSRSTVPQIRIRGQLIAKSSTPTLGQIQPHRSALLVSKYKINQVLDGQLDQPSVLVAQWALLDGREQPIVNLSIGAERELLLEPFDLNPQAQRYLYSDELSLNDEGERFLEIRE